MPVAAKIVYSQANKQNNWVNLTLFVPTTAKHSQHGICAPKSRLLLCSACKLIAAALASPRAFCLSLAYKAWTSRCCNATNEVDSHIYFDCFLPAASSVFQFLAAYSPLFCENCIAKVFITYVLLQYAYLLHFK